MAKPIAPSYPVTGEQARKLVQEIESANRGDRNPAQQEVLNKNIDTALNFFRNASAILSSKK
jgi:hypothetical protein